MTLAMKRKWANKSHLPEGWGLVWCQAFLLLLLLHSLPYSTGFHTPPHNPLPPHLCTSLQALHSMTVHFILFNTSHNLYSFCNKVPGGVADWVKGETGLKLSSPSPLLTLTQLCPCHLSPPPHHHLQNLLVLPQFGQLLLLLMLDIIWGGGFAVSCSPPSLQRLREECELLRRVWGVDCLLFKLVKIMVCPKYFCRTLQILHQAMGQRCSSPSPSLVAFHLASKWPHRTQNIV